MVAWAWEVGVWGCERKGFSACDLALGQRDFHEAVLAKTMIYFCHWAFFLDCRENLHPSLLIVQSRLIV